MNTGAEMPQRGRIILWLMGISLAGGAVFLLSYQEPATGQSSVSSENIACQFTVTPVQLWTGQMGIVVVDSQRQQMCVYSYQMSQPGVGRLTLMAARNLKWDMQLSDYNTGSPRPDEVKSILERVSQVQENRVSAGAGDEAAGAAAGSPKPSPGVAETEKAK